MVSRPDSPPYLSISPKAGSTTAAFRCMLPTAFPKPTASRTNERALYMRLLLPLLLLVLSTQALLAQPAEPVPPGHDLIPVLPYLFSDSASAAISDRYVQF